MTEPQAPAPAADASTAGPSKHSKSSILGPALLGFALLGSIVLLAYGGKRASDHGDYGFLLAGLVATVIALTAAGLATLLASIAKSLAESSTGSISGLERLAADVRRATQKLSDLDEHALISERAKQVAYRRQDREAVRKAIEEDLLTGDYASARQLADEFEGAFGYKLEADRFREEIRRRIEDARGHEIGEATGRVEQLCDEERWADAYAESDRLITKYDNDMRVKLLRTRIEERRQQLKVELVKMFHEAREQHDADAGAELLKRLDPYLTPEEGRQLEQEAREVFRDKLLSLKERYSQSMHGRDFSEVLRLGTIIRRDYPNSKLAKEVAQHEPRIREKAGLAPEEEAAPI
jgi:hypothetical protein